MKLELPGFENKTTPDSAFRTELVLPVCCLSVKFNLDGRTDRRADPGAAAESN